MNEQPRTVSVWVKEQPGTEGTTLLLLRVRLIALPKPVSELKPEEVVLGRQLLAEALVAGCQE